MGTIVEEEKCGKYIMHGDLTAFIEAVKYFSEHPDERKIMGKNGRSLLLKMYTAYYSYRIIAEHFQE